MFLVETVFCEKRLFFIAFCEKRLFFARNGYFCHVFVRNGFLGKTYIFHGILGKTVIFWEKRIFLACFCEKRFYKNFQYLGKIQFPISNFKSQTNPSFSSKPNIILKFCKACPAAPFIKLSIALTRISLLPDR